MTTTTVPTRESVAAEIAALTQIADDANHRLSGLTRARSYLDSALAVIDDPDADLRAAAEAMDAALTAELNRTRADAEKFTRAANGAGRAARRIDKLTPGQVVELDFGGHFTAANEFVGIAGEGETRRATFRTALGADEDRLPVSEWEAYRYSGSWTYGSGAERLSIVVGS